MKFRTALFFSLLTLLVACVENDQQNEAQEEETFSESDQSVYYKHLTGTVGDKSAIFELHKFPASANLSEDEEAENTDHYDGTLIIEGEYPASLEGVKLYDSSIQMRANTDSHIDSLSLKIKGNSFSGTVLDTSGTKRSFQFKEDYPEGTYQWDFVAYSDSSIFESKQLDSTSPDTLPLAVTDLRTVWPKDHWEDDSKKFAQSSVASLWSFKHSLFDSADSLLRFSSDDFLKNYQSVSKEWSKTDEEPLSATFNWFFVGSTEVLFNAKNIVSLQHTGYQYTGGAHGLQTELCQVIDLENNQTILLSDIFKRGIHDKLQKALENELRRVYEIPSDEELNGKQGVLFEPHLSISRNFYLTNEGIEFVYNPYEIAAYVYGAIHLYLPFKNVQDLLSDDFNYLNL